MEPIRDPAQVALENCWKAMQQGERQIARRWALRAATLAPDAEDPWLFLAALASPRASVGYLEQVMKINPENRRAQKGMQWAIEHLDREQSVLLSKQGLPTPQERDGSIPSLSTQSHSRKSGKKRSRSRNLRRFSSHWQNWIGILLAFFFIIVAIAVPWISPNSPNSSGPFMHVKGSIIGDQQPHPPSLNSPLGSLPGQVDVFHALVWGTRDALVFGLEISLISAFLGVFLGAVAGYSGGPINGILMRITDAFTAFPIIAGIVLLNQLWVTVSISLGAWFDAYHNVWVGLPDKSTSFIQGLMQSVNPLTLIFILFTWMPHARITNAIVLSLKQAEFIQAARAIGAKPIRIIFRHLLPNSIAPSIVMAARDVGGLVILQATFTFINLDSSSTWGRMLVMGKDWVLGPGGGILTYWWVFIPATLVLIFFGVGWNLLGDGLAELLDPRDE